MSDQEKAAATFRRGALLALGALSVLLLFYISYLIRNIIVILILAGFWAYFLAWPVQALRRWMSAKAAVNVVFYTSFLVILGMLGPIGNLLFQQINELISRFDTMTAALERAVNSLDVELLPGQPLRLDESLNNALEELRTNAPALLSRAFDASQSFLSSTAEVLVALIIIPLVALYLLLDSERLRRAFIEVFPSRMRSDVDRVMTAVNRSLGSYIYSRVILALFAGGAMMVCLALLGVPFSLVLGLLAFISEFIPVVGAFVAIVPILLIAIATKPAWVIVSVIAAFVVIQLVQSYVLTPKLMSETMDIHPLTVVVAMLVGGNIGGFAGLLLAIPAAAALKVVFNVFVLRRTEKGVMVPALDLIGANHSSGGVEIREAVPTTQPAQQQPNPTRTTADLTQPPASTSPKPSGGPKGRRR